MFINRRNEEEKEYEEREEERKEFSLMGTVREEELERRRYVTSLSKSIASTLYLMTLPGVF